MDNSLPSAAERPARSIHHSSLSTSDGFTPGTFVRMYHMPHQNVVIHTHIGRYTAPVLGNRRVSWVSMTIADLIFTSLTRREVAQALWLYRHDPQLTITELRPAAQ